MANKRKIISTTTTTEEAPAALEIETEQEKIVDPEIEELSTFFNQLGSSANLIKIYKFVDGQKSYCGAAEPSVVTEDYILHRYGGGKYQCQALNNGRYVTGGFKAVNIYEPPIDTLKAKLAADREPASNNGEIASLKDALNRQQEMILRLIEKNSVAAAPALGPSMADITSMMRDIAAMAPKHDNPMNALAPVLDLVKTTMEISKEAVNGENPSSFWPKIIGDALQKIPMILGAMRPSGSGQPAAPGENPGGEMGIIQNFLVWGIGELKKKALAGKDPALYADLILDNIDDAKWMPFVGLVNRPFEEFVSYDVELKNPPFNAWFKELFETVKRGLDGNIQTNVDAGEIGRDSDSKGNAPADN